MKEKRERQKRNRKSRYSTPGCYKLAQRARRILRGRDKGDERTVAYALETVKFVLNEKEIGDA